MAFKDIERKRIERAPDGFLEKRRPPPYARPNLDFGYRISGQSVEIFEIRPRLDKPAEKRGHPFAKATYVRTRDLWKSFGCARI